MWGLNFSKSSIWTCSFLHLFNHDHFKECKVVFLLLLHVFIYLLTLCVCVWGSEHNLPELILTSALWVLRSEFRSPGLVANTPHHLTSPSLWLWSAFCQLQWLWGSSWACWSFQALWGNISSSLSLVFKVKPFIFVLFSLWNLGHFLDSGVRDESKDTEVLRGRAGWQI